MSSSIKQSNSTENAVIFRKKILYWYDEHRRVLPWRALNGHLPDPYHVWLSEIMLQQTTVKAVIPYFIKFVKAWPNIHALAQADRGEVLSAWAGLGYYARARNLHKCAQYVSNELCGSFPEDVQALKGLPGIGDYTSAAISSIAFDRPAVVIDGNVERVFSRLFCFDEPLPKGKRLLREIVAGYSDGFIDRPGDYAQALMDLGANICTPRSPSCYDCPVSEWCKARVNNNVEGYPVKERKKTRPTRYGYVYFVRDVNGRVLVHNRPEEGLLGGMIGLPTSEWDINRNAICHLDFLSAFTMECLSEEVKHTFTHFDLVLMPIFIKAPELVDFDDAYSFVEAIDSVSSGFPSVFKKVLSLFSF